MAEEDDSSADAGDAVEEAPGDAAEATDVGAAEAAISRLIGLRALKAAAALGEDAFEAIVAQAPKWERDDWAPGLDVALLQGIRSHGFGNWAVIRDDRSLGWPHLSLAEPALAEEGPTRITRTPNVQRTSRRGAARQSIGEQFVVEKLLRQRDVHGKREYLVKWKGYPDKSDNTWEPENELLETKALAVFEAEEASKRHKAAWPAASQLVARGEELLASARAALRKAAARVGRGGGER